MIFSATVFLLAQAAATPATQPKAAPQLPTKAALEAQTKALFERLDANKDGKVDRAEAEKAHAAAAARIEERRQKQRLDAFAKVDTNKDGLISRQEFDAAGKRPTPKEAWFDANDIDKNGAVQANEALAKAQNRFDLIDTNKDGVLQATELRAARNRNNTARR